MTIEQRLAKLEQRTRAMGDPDRVPGMPEEIMQQIRQVAAVVQTPAELVGYLRTREVPEDRDVVSLEGQRSADAARAAFARSVFEEVRNDTLGAD